MTNSLITIQKQFQNYLLQFDEEIFPQIISNEQADAEERLDIYANGYRMRLIEVLEEDFPIVKEIMGEQPFYECARLYIESNQSQYHSLRTYGAKFPLFLKKTKPYAAKKILAECAEFSWALLKSFDAVDQVPFKRENIEKKITKDAWPDCRLILHPSVHTLRLEWNVGELVNAHHEKKPLPKPKKKSNAVTWLFWRHDYEAYYRSLSAAEAYMIYAMEEQKIFTDICLGLTHWFNENKIPVFVAQVLNQWFDTSIIADIVY